MYEISRLYLYSSGGQGKCVGWGVVVGSRIIIDDEPHKKKIGNSAAVKILKSNKHQP
jgi:hypothetical protein